LVDTEPREHCFMHRFCMALSTILKAVFSREPLQVGRAGFAASLPLRRHRRLCPERPATLLAACTIAALAGTASGKRLLIAP